MMILSQVVHDWPAAIGVAVIIGIITFLYMLTQNPTHHFMCGGKWGKWQNERVEGYDCQVSYCEKCGRRKVRM